MALAGLKQEDQSYVIANRGLEGVQIASVAATPLFLLHSIRTRTFSLRRLGRINWTLPLVGGGLGAAAGWVQASQTPPSVLARRVAGLRQDVDRIRRDDFHLIGAVLGSLSLPALFLRRVGLVNGALGGLGLGGAIGVVTFYGMHYAGAHKTLEMPVSGEKPIPEVTAK
ncbi:hypothetical protein MSPP1_001596 [Malassezia sp. CBS 17886]|nr:hypothetical protein MSPP1_001596 [Malassezia sp. CBS 17886]